MFWGVFMLVALLGGGQGLKEMLQSNFEGFATNSAIILAQPTTKPYAGFRKERQWSMVYNDVVRLEAACARAGDRLARAVSLGRKRHLRRPQDQLHDERPAA